MGRAVASNGIEGVEMSTKAAELRAQEFNVKLADSRLFWLPYRKGFRASGVMVFDVDLVLSGDRSDRGDATRRPVSGDLLLIGQGHRIESVAMLDVSPCVDPGKLGALTLSLTMGALKQALTVPQELQQRRPAGAVECGRMERCRISDFEMTGRVMRLSEPCELALRRDLRLSVTAEFLSYV